MTDSRLERSIEPYRSARAVPEVEIEFSRVAEFAFEKWNSSEDEEAFRKL